MSGGILLRKEDAGARGRAKVLGLEVAIGSQWAIPWDHALIVAAGVRIPWDLVPAGLHFTERWDAAAPVWRYDVLAADLGTPAERERTERIVRDLRVPVYAPELLFLRKGPGGEELLARWRAECEGKADPRLAFVRALYLVKPIFCALPKGWLADAGQRAVADRRVAQRMAGVAPLVKVQIGPGRFVRCRAGEEERVREAFRSRQERRDLKKRKGAR